MKITLNKPERKLVAVLGVDGAGLFLEDPNGAIYFLDVSGKIRQDRGSNSLEQVVRDDKYRTGIYKGDSITLQF